MNQTYNTNLTNTESAANTANTGMMSFIWLAVVLFILVVTGVILLYRREKRIRQTRAFIQRSTAEEKERYINDLIEPSGFRFNAKKDIFYAMKNTWQKHYGYSTLYDEAAAPFGMIIDCEPIYFSYDGKKWMLEFWKGQYGMTAGGEIGLYTAKDDREKFYQGVDADDYIGMQMELFLRGQQFFERKGNHWWLTGFRLGECTAPKELKMVITLTFFNRLMCQSFVDGLRRAGYGPGEYQAWGDTVKILFYTPHTKQPSTRGPIIDRFTLWRLKLFCKLYKFYTREYSDTSDRLISLQAKAPWLFAQALMIGKTAKLFERNQEHETFTEN